MAIVFLLLLLPALHAGSCEKLYSPYPSQQALLEAHAPAFLQWVGSPWQWDVFVPIGFDEKSSSPMREWRTLGNAKNSVHPEAAECEGRPGLRPVVYGGLIAATRHQWYLVYYYYHANDRGELFTRNVGDWFGRILGVGRGYHENDMEGGYLVVDRSSQRVIHYAALAHNGFDDRHSGAADSGFEPGDGVVIASEGGKHGAHLHVLRELLGHSGSPDSVGFPGKRDGFVHYVGVAGNVERQTGQPRPKAEWRDAIRSKQGTAYRIDELWPLFKEMFAPDRPSCSPSDFWTSLKGYPDLRLAMGRDSRARIVWQRHQGKLSVCTALRGEQDNQAKFPWGQHQNLERFFDPVQNLLKREDVKECRGHSVVSIGYEFNPYLQALLKGQVPEWTDQSCPDFEPSP